jgi:hypothetical protein
VAALACHLIIIAIEHTDDDDDGDNHSFLLLVVGEGKSLMNDDPHVAYLSIIIRACNRIDSRLISQLLLSRSSKIIIYYIKAYIITSIKKKIIKSSSYNLGIKRNF